MPEKNTNAPSTHRAEFRASPRYKLPAMYTLVRVRPVGTQRYRWTGYVYDISKSGMRIELDHALPPGAKVEVHAMLPGRNQIKFNASGSIIRRHEDDDKALGPVRMGMAFDHFAFIGDERRLAGYLDQAKSLAA